MVAPLCADAGPVLDRTFGLPSGHTGPLRRCSRHAAQQNQVGVGETDQSGARGGGSHQKGGSYSFTVVSFWMLPHDVRFYNSAISVSGHICST